jgi:hypothetical protein
LGYDKMKTGMIDKVVVRSKINIGKATAFNLIDLFNECIYLSLDVQLVMPISVDINNYSCKHYGGCY